MHGCFRAALTRNILTPYNCIFPTVAEALGTHRPILVESSPKMSSVISAILPADGMPQRNGCSLLGGDVVSGYTLSLLELPLPGSGSLLAVHAINLFQFKASLNYSDPEPAASDVVAQARWCVREGEAPPDQALAIAACIESAAQDRCALPCDGSCLECRP